MLKIFYVTLKFEIVTNLRLKRQMSSISKHLLSAFKILLKRDVQQYVDYLFKELP